jgi:tripartite-type tricarboxylate transporter receptor subunit TctC
VTLRPQAESGRIKLLGLAGTRRQDFAPELAPISDFLPGFSTAAWQGLAVRSGTPPAERERLAQAYGAAMRDPQVRAPLIAQGLEPVGSTPQEFADVLRADYEKWGPIIRKAGLKND